MVEKRSKKVVKGQKDKVEVAEKKVKEKKGKDKEVVAIKEKKEAFQFLSMQDSRVLMWMTVCRCLRKKASQLNNLIMLLNF